MPLILRSFSVSDDALSLHLAAVRENSLDPHASPSRGQALLGNGAQTKALRFLRLRVTGDECPMTSKAGSFARQARESPPQRTGHDRVRARNRFEIESLVENLTGLEKFTIGAGNVETQSYERSRQPIENKDQLFSRGSESRQLDENRWLIFCKAVNILKNQVISLRRDNHETAC